MVRFRKLYVEAFMRGWLAFLIILGGFVFPWTAKAQNPIKLSILQVQLWPEYDQPSMLVISDFKLPDSVKLPVSVSMRIPKDAHLMAVATLSSNKSLLNTDYIGPVVSENWQTVTIQIQTPTTYHLEYYQPLSRTGDLRQFAYLWPGDYAIDDISISIRIPPDTTNIVTNPDMKSTKGADGGDYLIKDFGALGAGQQFPLQVTYTKTSEALSVPQESVQPSQPLGSNTPGRVMLSNYLPYILGVLGVLLLGGASIYLLQSRRKRPSHRQRSHAGSTSGSAKTDIYCHQCGARALPGDRFCRVCGTRLRLDA
jgi:zinc ribbon protein